MAGFTPTVFTADRVSQAPEDPLFGLMTAYRKDNFDKKVDLGIGAYRDNNAKPWVLPVVKKVCEDRRCLTECRLIQTQADEILRNDPNLNHEYLPISGLADFTSAAQKLMLGTDSPAIKEKRVSSINPGFYNPSILINYQGNQSSNHLRHRCPPSRRSLPLQIPPSPLESARLFLLPNMG